MPEVYRLQGEVYVLSPCDYEEGSSYPPSVPTIGIPCDYLSSPIERRFLQSPPDPLPS